MDFNHLPIAQRAKAFSTFFLIILDVMALKAVTVGCNGLALIALRKKKVCAHNMQTVLTRPTQ